MGDFINNLKNNYTNMTKMTIFNYLKTNNPAFDAILSTIIISIFGYCINYIYDNNLDKYLLKDLNYDTWCGLFYTKSSVIIEGKRCATTCAYNLSCNVSSLYSDRFKSIWDYIITNIDKNKSIFQIKEAHTNFQSSDHTKKTNVDIFMVHQNKHFNIDKHIYFYASNECKDSKDDDSKVSTTIDKMSIVIYSYVYSVSYLKNYIDTITDKYLTSIKNSRNNKRFIYSLDKVKSGEDDSPLNCWRENEFESSRTFNNIFFDGKKELIERINFFINNRDWYYEKGITYSLGIGLHGPPGTGKTSVIKALANLTDRHLIVISLKLIKTKRQLEHFFFENTYNDKNEQTSITFNKKIIVFEDIDCIGDIVLNREPKNKLTSSKRVDVDVKNEISNVKNSDVKIGDVIQGIRDLNNTSTNLQNYSSEDPITLDDILNLWDGIRETPGRILIISSNHYDKLDSALTRPGRIDITHELSNASHNTISELYLHLFGTKIDKSKLKKIKEFFYSPAELINIYINNKNEDAFICRLLLNAKI